MAMLGRLGEIISARGYALADGAMGTQLFEAGLTSGDSPELWNLDRPETVQDIHRRYFEAGSDLVVTNSFGGNRFRLALHGLDDRVGELNRAAAANARAAADGTVNSGDEIPVQRPAAASARAAADGAVNSGDEIPGQIPTAANAGAAADGTGRTMLVAGSMGPTGELLEPLGAMSAQACEEAFAEQARGLAEGGADLLWIETMSDLSEAEAAVRGARAACDLPVAVTMSFDTAGRTMMGVTGSDMARRLQGLGLAAMGANCGANLADTGAAAAAIAAEAGGTPVVCKPNAGVPVWRGGGLVYDGTPEVMAAGAVRARRAGAAVIGACCGSTPEHIAAIAAALQNGA